MEKTCKVEGCKRPYRAKGYCQIHFNKWRKGEMDKKPRYKTCDEEKCNKPLHKAGKCQQHYEALVASKKLAAEPVKVATATPATPAAPAPKTEAAAAPATPASTPQS